MSKDSHLTLSWRRPISYRNQSIDLPCKSMDSFLYDNGLRHERVNIAWADIDSATWKKFYYLFVIPFLINLCYFVQNEFFHQHFNEYCSNEVKCFITKSLVFCQSKRSFSPIPTILYSIPIGQAGSQLWRRKNDEYITEVSKLCACQ